MDIDVEPEIIEEPKKNNDYTNSAKLILLILVIIVVLYITYRFYNGAAIVGGSILTRNSFRGGNFNKSGIWKSLISNRNKSGKHVKFDLRKSTVMKFNKNDRPIDLKKNNKWLK